MERGRGVEEFEHTAESPTLPLRRDTPPAEPGASTRQFLPGTRLGERYRIVELLGRGGMGEVYRADDLHLGHPVALKLLPERMVHDAAALARLRNEVRIARQVSHPNVCRVYDISEADGIMFVAMEYIDGEDLASVLRRLGRPSREKAIEIARQLCLGVAAAHETGVLHRDIKPDNIMIDGRGRVRITDFGLASFARDPGEAGYAGTPSYMAPELFRGAPGSARSDIYALGAVLYELFTGKRAFDAGSLTEIARLHQSASPKSPYEIVPDIEPIVESIISRCLDKNPEQRPASALAVAAALPGEDLVTLALAAGQTPSPEVIAEAGGKGALRPIVAAGLFLAVAAGIVSIAALNQRVSLYGLATPAKPSVVIADTARGILARLGYDAPPAHVAHGWQIYGEYLEHIRDTDPSPDRWSSLQLRRPPVHWLWYRESPLPLVPSNLMHEIRFHDPPLDTPGMAALKLDDRGRMAILRIVPPARGRPARVAGPIDYGWLFEAAGLDAADFVPVDSEWTPPDYADERRAWTGHYPEQPDWPVRVEAASLGGRPVYFNVLELFDIPASEKDRQASLLERSSVWFNVILLALALAVPPVLARRNLRRGTGDRTGAVRLGVTLCGLSFAWWLLWADHPPSVLPEAEMFLTALGMAVLLGVWAGLVYLGLEPYVRRLLPDAMISWTRLLMGRLTDARVGRDVLIGALAGTLVIMVQRLEGLVPTWFGAPPRIPFGGADQVLEGGRRFWAMLVQPGVFSGPLGVLVLFTTALYLLRRRWLAALATFLFLAIVDNHVPTEGPAVVRIAAIVEVVLVWGILLGTLIRFGLLSMVTCFFFFNVLQFWPLVLDGSAWFRGTAIAGMLVLAAVAALAARVSLGRSPRHGIG